MKTTRTQDLFYLKEKYYVKEYFKKISEFIPLDSKLKLADIGCSNGNFINFLINKFPKIEIFGVEYVKELQEIASKNNPNAKILHGDINNPNLFGESSLDLITVLGVLSIFDDLNFIVENLSRWIKKNGTILIFDMFNPYDYDVLIKYKPSLQENLTYEAGWNIISMKSISEIFYRNGAREIIFNEFRLDIDLHKNPDDPIRSWTEMLLNGSRIITNGLNIIQPQYILRINF